MKKQTIQPWLSYAILVTIILTLAGCNLKIQPPESSTKILKSVIAAAAKAAKTREAAATSTPALTPGIDFPVTGRDWEITFAGAYVETRLEDRFGNSVSTQDEYLLLVVDVMFADLVEPKRKLRATDFSVFTEEGTRLSPGTFALGFSLGMPSAVDSVDDFAYVDAANVINSYSTTRSEQVPILRLVLSVRADEVYQTYKLQFQDLPVIPFTVVEP